ncbi:hypothetical protein H4R19_004655, partial [Coemansia spiralis]
ARIKKIMQMDEEVGKMAQATPVLISKSLELFMQSIIDDMCKHTRVCNSRKVSPTHLKRCVESTECYDFLKDVVESVVDDGDGGGPQTCIAKVAELDAGAADVLGGGGGAPLSMILDAPPAADDSADDAAPPAASATGRGRGRGRGKGQGRGRGRASRKPALSTSEPVAE